MQWSVNVDLVTGGLRVVRVCVEGGVPAYAVVIGKERVHNLRSVYITAHLPGRCGRVRTSPAIVSTNMHRTGFVRRKEACPR